MKVFFEEYGTFILTAIICATLVILMAGIFSNSDIGEAINATPESGTCFVSSDTADNAVQNNGANVKIETKTGAISQSDLSKIGSDEWVIDNLIKKVSVSDKEVSKETLKAFCKSGRFSHTWTAVSKDTLKIVIRFVDYINTGRINGDSVPYTVRATATVRIVEKVGSPVTFKIDDEEYEAVSTTWKTWLRNSLGGMNYILDEDDYIKNTEGDMILVDEKDRKPVKPGEYIKDDTSYLLIPEGDITEKGEI